MIDQRGIIDGEKLNTTEVIVEIDEPDLPRFVFCWARWFVIGGEPVLRAVTADTGKYRADESWQFLSRDREAVQLAVDAAVTDTPTNSTAWSAIESAIERHREQSAESTRELFAQLRTDGDEWK